MSPDVAIFDPAPVRLVGPDVVLEPLGPGHAADLAVAGADADTWRYLLGRPFGDESDALAWIGEALEEQEAGTRIPFAVVEKTTGRAVGSTSYLEINRRFHTIEIGWTWLSPAVQRTHVNTQCKLTLMTHAFDVLGAIRLQWKTDLRNERSQLAIERLGATREGVLRHTMIMLDGHRRDTVYYSVLAEEWPAVRDRLEAKLRS